MGCWAAICEARSTVERGEKAKLPIHLRVGAPTLSNNKPKNKAAYR